MSPRSKAAPTTVTLEVSPRIAKVMTATLSPFQIQRAAASTVPEQTDDPVAALRALLGSQSLGVRQIGLLFGREAFSLRTLELPSTDPKEIASMLELQLGKLTPYPRNEILSAWAVIGSFREGYTSVLLAIARKALIDGVLQFLKTKGITPLWVGVSTEGVEAWWALCARQQAALPAEGQLTVIIDVDFISTDCAVFAANGRLLFTHSIALGADQLTASEQAKLRWVGELVRLPRILLHEDVKGRIGRGVITGFAAGLEGAVEQLTSQWGVAVDVMDSLKPFSPSAGVSQSASATHVSYTALAGILASGKPPRIDLIPQEARLSQALHARSRHLARLAGSLAAILVFAAMLYVERIIVWRHHLAQLQQQLGTLDLLSQRVRQREEAMRRVRGWLNPSRSALELFRSVAEAADPQITITQLAMQDGKPVTIRGNAGTMAEAFAFADRLKKQGKFTTVDTHPVLKPKAANELGAEFELICQWAGS